MRIKYVFIMQRYVYRNGTARAAARPSFAPRTWSLKHRRVLGGQRPGRSGLSADQIVEDAANEFGVPSGLVPCMETPLVLSRGEVLGLGKAGLLLQEAVAKPEGITY